MAIPVFPCALPCQVLRDSWSLEPTDPHRRTEMDDGTVAVRRKLYRIPLEIGAVWEMDRRQVGVFKSWWKTDLDAGALWFDGAVFDGVCMADARLQFTGTPPWRITQPHNGRFLVASKLKMRDVDVWDAATRERAEFDILTKGGTVATGAALRAAIGDLSF